MGKQKAAKSMGEKMAELVVDELENNYDEDLDFDTAARTVDYTDDLETTETRRSNLRAKNVKLLSEVDERYSGRKMTRGDFGDSSDDDDRLSEDQEGSVVDEEDEEEILASKVQDDDNDVNDDDEDERIHGSSVEDDDDEIDSNDEVDEEGESDEDDHEGSVGSEEDVEDDETIPLMSIDSEVEKAKCTQNQLRIWDSLLEIRIRMQRILISANKLPQTDTFHQITQSGQESQSALQSIMDLLRKLLELQESMSSETETKKVDPMNEEITSESEDEEESNSNRTPTPQPRSDSSSPPKKRAKLTPSTFTSQTTASFNSYKPIRNTTIQKWSDKTSLTMKNKTPILHQINHVLSDKNRLIKRTQTKRTAYNPICKDKDDVSVEDCEIFDDDDFYHQLLRELIERKSSGSDPVGLSRGWIELQKMRGKMKKVVDTKASKGRRIRFDVHPKLVGFMGSDQTPGTMAEGAIKELFQGLFGGIC